MLWVIVGAGTMVMLGALVARDLVATAQNRGDAARALWLAEGCVQAARAAIADAMAMPQTQDRVWRSVDTLTLTIPEFSGCELRAAASGTRRDVNTIDETQLRALLRAAGVDSSRTDSLVAAVLDWRDADSTARPGGAERGWYAGRELFTPADGPVTDPRELRRVRGYEGIPGLDSLLGTDVERIYMLRAPEAVIASLPGITAEAAARMIALRETRNPPRDLLALGAEVSPASRAEIVAHYPELASLVTFDPDAWTVGADARNGQRGASAHVELRLVRAGSRTAILRRREW